MELSATQGISFLGGPVISPGRTLRTFLPRPFLRCPQTDGEKGSANRHPLHVLDKYQYTIVSRGPPIPSDLCVCALYIHCKHIFEAGRFVQGWAACLGMGK